MRRVLVLRPEPGAAATAARAAALGLEAVVAPLFVASAVPWQAERAEAFDALMLTSANAVRLGGAQLARYRHLPVFAVGEATAAAARAAGFVDVHAGASDVVALLDMVAVAAHRRLLHLAGREHRDATHSALHLTRIIVYSADPVSALPDAAVSGLTNGAVALLHSPRAAAHFANLVDDRGTVRIAAISAAAASAAGDGWAAVAVAERPDDAALLAAAARLCDQAD